MSENITKVVGKDKLDLVQFNDESEEPEIKAKRAPKKLSLKT